MARCHHHTVCPRNRVHNRGAGRGVWPGAAAHVDVWPLHRREAGQEVLGALRSKGGRDSWLGQVSVNGSLCRNNLFYTTGGDVLMCGGAVMPMPALRAHSSTARPNLTRMMACTTASGASLSNPANSLKKGDMER